MHDEYKYFAFISYNYLDVEWGRKLQRKLEGYRMPATLCSEHGWGRKPINPVFFAPTDIQPGGLSAELQSRLKASRNLIVICSPHSAQSEWVGMEIEYFHSLGRTESIHFFIVDGVPNSGDPQTECFNPVVKKLGIPEILGANIHENVSRWNWENRERAYVQLVTKLLGIEFDSIWQRHKRIIREKKLLWTVGFAAVLSIIVGVWKQSQPVDVHISLNETGIHNERLPLPVGAVVSLYLDNEIKVDTLDMNLPSICFSNVPHRAIGKSVRMKFECPGWNPLDSLVSLSECTRLDIRRDSDYFGRISFALWNEEKECFVKNASVTISGITTVSDSDGIVKMLIPLEKQEISYKVECSVPLLDTILVMPVTNSQALRVKAL